VFEILFTRQGRKDLERLSSPIRNRIENKLLAYASHANPLIFAKPLVNLPPATHRFRIGKYRISFFVHGNTIYVERIEIRGKAYR
jgi:mRNA-degrading endonuclease RelE of RelBE toxin-antitoxin system